MCYLETESTLEETKEGDDQSEDETSVGQEQEEPKQPTDSKTDTPQTRAAIVKEKLKSILLLLLFYGKWILDKLIGFLNGISKNYRAVAKELKKARREKRPRDSIRDYRLRDMTTSESMEEDSVDAKVCYGGGRCLLLGNFGRALLLTGEGVER